MLELLFAFLEVFLEILFETAFEFAAESLGALVLRGVAEVFDTSEFKNPLLASVGYVFLGGVAGRLSLLFFPHPLVHRSRVPGLSVVVCFVPATRRVTLVDGDFHETEYSQIRKIPDSKRKAPYNSCTIARGLARSHLFSVG
jgi:hypothetical protein